ncbi:MAG TPA: carnitine dehydratase, partial [Alphaproteobacteria bacterium]|nr:carnitine dehydratase [Alphaproteobacteria bacterium]
QHVRLSMLEAVVAFLWSSDMGAQTYIGKKVSQQRAASFIDLIYETRDGYMSVAVMTNTQWAGLTRALQRPEWLDDPRFATTELRDLNIDERLSLTQSVLIERTTDDWMARLEAEGVPCAPVLTRNDMITHPQILATDIIMQSEHPAAGPLRQARTPARFSGTSPEYRHGAPQLGQHRSEILREAGISEDDEHKLEQKGVFGSR